MGNIGFDSSGHTLAVTGGGRSMGAVHRVRCRRRDSRDELPRIGPHPEVLSSGPELLRDVREDWL